MVAKVPPCVPLLLGAAGLLRPAFDFFLLKFVLMWLPELLITETPALLFLVLAAAWWITESARAHAFAGSLGGVLVCGLALAACAARQFVPDRSDDADYLRPCNHSGLPCRQ